VGFSDSIYAEHLLNASSASVVFLRSAPQPEFTVAELYRSRHCRDVGLARLAVIRP
jgi:hypothetical protein